MGIEKIRPRLPAGMPQPGNRPDAEGSPPPAAGRVSEDARTGIRAGRESELSPPEELPAGFGPVLGAPGLPGALFQNGRSVGGVEGLRALAAGSPGGTLSGERLAGIRLTVEGPHGSEVVSPADIGLVAVSAS